METMTSLLGPIRRSHPLFRGLLLLYLAGTLLIVAGHQHHNALQGHDCALCTVAHTPAMAASAPDPVLAPCSTETALAIPAEQGWDSNSHRATRSRAPPLV
jgi:hypothetical protein